MRSGANGSPGLTRCPLASVMAIRAIGSAPGFALLNVRRYCSSSQRIISCSSLERALEVRPSLDLRDLCLLEATDVTTGSDLKVTSRGCVGGASSGLMDEVILFSSDVASSFAMGLETSIVDVSAGDGGLAAIAAECVGVNRMFPPSLGISPSSILWSGLAVEFVCLLLFLSFLEEFEGVGFALFFLDDE